jgi:hypothetical protein
MTIIDKRYKSLMPVLTAVILILLVRPPEAASSEKGTVFVIGFSSSLINDVQNRLLRENVLRHFRSRRYSIVPVMEYERVFREKPESYTRTMNRAVLKKYSIHFSADYAVAGSIEQKVPGNRRKKIMPGILYTCRLIIYSRAGDSFVVLKFNINGSSNYFRFFERLSEEIVLNCENVMSR